MTDPRQRLGRRGEDAAARYLERLGWLILARNERVPGIRGELDIVALDGGELVVVEVKAIRPGNRAGPGSPLEQVGPLKRARLRRLAGAWVHHRGDSLPTHRGLRIDVVGLVCDRDGRVVGREHVRAAC